jgi:hypothetical protein
MVDEKRDRAADQQNAEPGDDPLEQRDGILHLAVIRPARSP